MALGSFNAFFYLFFGICSTSAYCDDFNMLTLLQSASSKNKLFLRRPNSSSVDGDSQHKHVKEAFEGKQTRESLRAFLRQTPLKMQLHFVNTPPHHLLQWFSATGPCDLCPPVTPHERLCVIVSLGYFLEARVCEMVEFHKEKRMKERS